MLQVELDQPINLVQCYNPNFRVYGVWSALEQLCAVIIMSDNLECVWCGGGKENIIIVL